MALRDLTEKLKKQFSLQNIRAQAQALPQLTQQTPFAQRLRTVLNKPVQSNVATRGLISAARPLQQPLQQFGTGFIQASTFGLASPKTKPISNFGEALGYGLGFGAGVLNPINPVSKLGVWNKIGQVGARPTQAIISRIAPKASGFLTKKLIPSIASEAAQTGAYGLAKKALGQPFDWKTDLAIGLVGRGGLGKFQPDLPTGKIKVRGIDKFAALDNEDAKTTARLLVERGQGGMPSMEWYEGARKIIVDKLKVKPKEFSKMRIKDIVFKLEESLTSNQKYAYQDLAMGIVGKPTQASKSAQAGLYDTTGGYQNLSKKMDEAFNLFKTKRLPEEGMVIGNLGEFISHPRTFKEFESIRGVPVRILGENFIDAKTNQYVFGKTGRFGVFMKDSPITGRPEIWINPKAHPLSAQSSMIHEAIHALQNQKGRSVDLTQPYKVRPHEVTARKGADYWVDLERSVQDVYGTKGNQLQSSGKINRATVAEILQSPKKELSKSDILPKNVSQVQSVGLAPTRSQFTDVSRTPAGSLSGLSELPNASTNFAKTAPSIISKQEPNINVAQQPLSVQPKGVGGVPTQASKGVEPIKAQLKSMAEGERKIDELLGTGGGLTGNWKQDYVYRQKMIDELKSIAPPEVVAEVEKIQNAIADFQVIRTQIESNKRVLPNVASNILRKAEKTLDDLKLDKKYFQINRDELGRPISVSYTPPMEQVGKVARERVRSLERNAKQEFIDWEKQLFQQEGAVKPSKLVDDAVKSIKESTGSIFTKSPENLKDISGFSGYFRDVHRNFQKVFGKSFQSAKELYLDPLFVGAKSRYLKEQEGLIKELDDTIIKNLGIKPKSRESQAVQLFGEKQISEADLLGKFGQEKANKIIQADSWFRQKYDSLLDEVNRVRQVIYPNNRDKIIPKRQDYYRHFQELAQGYKALFNIFETPAGISSKLAGVSYQTKPKSKWLSFAQKRLGMTTEEDAVSGFLNYIKASSYAKNIDPQIERFRGLANELSSATAEGESAGKLNNFILYLNRFADDLSGKTNPIDRVMQEMGGRKVFRVLDWANTRIKANVILGNLSSSVAQIFNVPQGIADVGPTNALKGMGKSLADIFNPKNPMKMSPFIKERYFRAYDKFDTGMLSNTKRFAAWMTQVLDEVGTKYIWNSEYEKALSQRIKNPIIFADDATRRLVAGRGIGEVPIGQKSRIFQMIAPFQLEVTNLWWVMKDMVDQRQFGKLVTLFVANYVFNKGAEEVRGSGVTFDPINAMFEAYQTYQQEEDKRIGGIRAGGRISGEILSNVPIGQTAAAMYPEYGFKIPGTDETLTRKEFFGREDPTRFGGGFLVGKGLQDPLYKLVPPFGGMQIKKTLQGAQNIAQGYSESAGGGVQFPVEKTPVNIAKSLAFGKYGSKEATEYFKSEGKVLGDKQSTIFKASNNKKATYEQIQYNRGLAKELGVDLPSLKEPTQEFLDEQTAKLEVRKTQEIRKANNKVFYWNDNEGSVGSISLDFKVEYPKLTSSEAMNKELISTYKGKISTQINHVRTLYEIGYLSQNEAIAELERLQKQYNATKKPKKPKNITIKKATFKPVKLTKSKGIKIQSIKLPQPPKTKKISVKAIKITGGVNKVPQYKIKTFKNTLTSGFTKLA